MSGYEVERRVDEFNRDLEGPQDLLSMGIRLAKSLAAIRRHDEASKAVRNYLKGRRATLTKISRRAEDAMNTRVEVVEDVVSIMVDPTAGMAKVVRASTGEIVSERVATPAEIERASQAAQGKFDFVSDVPLGDAEDPSLYMKMLAHLDMDVEDLGLNDIFTDPNKAVADATTADEEDLASVAEASEAMARHLGVAGMDSTALAEHLNKLRVNPPDLNTPPGESLHGIYRTVFEGKTPPKLPRAELAIQIHQRLAGLLGL
jgi:hypothetical protein